MRYYIRTYNMYLEACGFDDIHAKRDALPGSACNNDVWDKPIDHTKSDVGSVVLVVDMFVALAWL